MKRSAFSSLILVALFSASGCQSPEVRSSPSGHYFSHDDAGVFVFRPDGVFGYRFATMLDVFNEQNLPPERGHWKLTPEGSIEIQLDDSAAKKFRLEWHPKDNAFDLIRLEPDGTLPVQAHYEHG